MPQIPAIDSEDAEDKPFVWLHEARSQYRDGQYVAASAAAAIAHAMMIGRGRA